MNTILAWQRPFSADLEIAIERLGWVLVHSLWQFFIVVLITFFMLRVMQRSSATARYGFLVGVMGIMVTIPIATWMILPSHFRIDLPDQQLPVTQLETNAQPNIELNFPVEMRDPGIGNDHINPLPGSDVIVSKLGIEQALPVSNQDANTPTDLTWMMYIQSVVQPWLTWIVAGWVVGVILCSLRPILGWRMLRRLRREGVSSFSEDVQATVFRLSKQLGLRRVVNIMQSTLIKVPVVVGHLHPVILLPVSLLTSMPPSQLEAILAHELAHVRRHDFVINLLQTMIETLFFYHPAVWWLSNRVRVEREHCCDDMVVTCIGNNVEYGRALLAIAEHSGRYSVLALGVADGSLLSRVRRIVGVGSDGTPQRWIDRWPAVLSVVTLIGVAIGLLIWNGMKHDADLPEPVTEADPKVQRESPETISPMLKLLNFDGTPAPSVSVMLASTGFPRESTPYWSQFTDSEGVVSLEKVPSGTHWLTAGGDSSVSAAFEVTLPTRDAVIERRLRMSSEIAPEDVTVAAHVEGEFPEEVIFIEITNEASEPITISSSMDISFTTEPGLYRAFFLPRRNIDEPTGQLAFSESMTLYIEWSKLVREGLWKHRLDEEIDEPWSSFSEPGKIQVRVEFGGHGTVPVFLTSPETIFAQKPPVVRAGPIVVDVRILKQLDEEKVSLVHTDVSWRELLEKIEDKGRFEIWVDMAAITNAELNLDFEKKISIEAVDVPLRKVIEQICEKVGGGSLGFVVEDRVLKITDAETARKANEKQKATLAKSESDNGGNKDVQGVTHTDRQQVINDGTREEKSKSDTVRTNALEDLHKTPELRLDAAFNKDLDGVPVSEVLENIAQQLGAKLNIDYVEIWADSGSDGLLSTSITLMNVYERMKSIEGQGHLSDWAVSMLARGDGTISFRETLSAITEPLALDFDIVNDTLQISSWKQIELLRKTKSISKKKSQIEEDRGLRTRVVCAWPHRFGKPLALKIEVRNFSNVVRQFDPQSVRPDRSIKVVGPDGKPIPFRSPLILLTGEIKSINPGETITLFETDDFSKFFELAQAGRYEIQYNGDDAKSRRMRGDLVGHSLPASLPLFIDLVGVPADEQHGYVNVKDETRAFVGLPEQRIVTVDFQRTPLDRTLEEICKSVFVKLELDVDGLKTVGVTKNVVVTITAENKPLQEILTHLLKPYERLSFSIDKNRVFVSSRERVAARVKESSIATRIGTVVSTDNMPVAGIEVLVFVGGNHLDQKFVTDERGEFRIPKAWGESSQIRKLVARDGNRRLGWYDFYFHRQTGSGETSNEDPFQIVLLPINQTIRGRVLDDQGKPLAGVELPVEYLDNKSNHASMTWRYFKPIDNPQFLRGVTNDDGEFEIHVPVDSMAMFSTRHLEWMMQHISVIQNLRDKIPDIKLSRAAIVSGLVLDSRTGTPLASARVTALADEPNLAIGGFGDAITDADGKYLIGGLNRGKFHIFFAEATERKLTAVAQEVNLEIGKSAEVNLSAIVGKQLSGRVVDAKSGQPISGRTVTYTGPARLGGNNSTADTDENGGFEFFVPPGRSKVAAAEHGLVGLDSFREVDVPAEGELEPVVLKVGTPAFDGPPEKRIVTLDFQRTPLHEAVDKICKSAVVTLELDVEGLKTQGLTKNVTVMIATQDQPLQEALTLLLKPFERLSFTIDKNRVFVSSRDRVAAREKERALAMAQATDINGDPQNSKDGDADQNSKDLETDNILGRIVTLDAKELPLREAFIQLARAAKVPLELDEPELTIAKVDLKAPVTIKIVDEQLWTAITQLIELNDEIDLQQIIASRPGSRKLFLTTLNGYVKRNLDDSPDWMKPSNVTGLHPSIDDDGQVVSVVATSLTDDLLKRLTELPKLRELDISGETKLTAEGLVHFADFPVLEIVSISGSANLEAGIADEIVKQIVRVKSLRTLSLSETGVTDVGIRMLKDSPLTSLSLYQEGRITNEALAVIVTLSRLKHLSLTSYVGTEKLGWMRFSPAGMNQLSSMKNLETLAIPGLPASVDISGFSRLTTLDMGGEFIDDGAAQRISELRGLRNLTLADVRMTEAGWKKIATLTGLQRISISRCRISDEVLAEFQGMTKLNFLELRAYGFSDIGLGHLAKVKSLNRLDLWGSNFTVQGLQQLRDLPNLRTLWLNGFQDQGSYLGLKDLQQLRELSFLMSNINQAEFTELEKAMPKTRITSMTGGGSLRSIRNPNAF